MNETQSTNLVNLVNQANKSNQTNLTLLAEHLPTLVKGLELLTELKKQIRRKLKKGVHYDKPFKGATKNILLKPGADAIALLLGIEVLDRKEEAVTAQGNIVGWKVTLTLKSKLLGTQTTISRICSKDEPKAKNWSLDMLLAMAHKRAWVYGVLQLSGLSDMFVDEERDEITKATPKQIEYLRKLLTEKRLVEKVEAKYGPLEELSRATASMLIEKLNGKV
jgi:hypothetical protein